MRAHTRIGIIATTLLLAGCQDSNERPPARREPPPRPASMDFSDKTGKELYNMHCLPCHGAGGIGVTNVFPALKDSPRLQVGEHFVHGLIHGYPPVTDSSEQRWMGEMPKFAHLSDEDLARLSNYVRQTWGNASDEITVEMVTEQRKNP